MTTWAIIYFLIDVSSMNDEIEKIMNIVGRVSLMNDWGGGKKIVLEWGKYLYYK